MLTHLVSMVVVHREISTEDRFFFLQLSSRASEAFWTGSVSNHFTLTSALQNNVEYVANIPTTIETEDSCGL